MTPPALVQVVKAVAGTTATAAITPTAGNFLVYIAGAIGGGGANNFSDTSGSNVLHTGTPSVVSGDNNLVGAMDYVLNCAGGSPYNVSATNTSGDPIVDLFVCEFSNMPRSGAVLDRGGSALVTNPLVGTTQNSGTLVTEFELELLIGMLFINSNGAVAGGGGAWTTIATSTNGFSCCEYQVLASQSGSGRQFSAPFSTPAAGGSLIGIASFKWSFTSLSVVDFSSP